MTANNETGALQPWQAIQSWCQAHQIAYFSDAVQWLGRLPAQGLGKLDWVSGCGHKHGGPKGVGFLKCATKGRVEPLMVGGPQELNRRAGTENVAGILSMVAAFKEREDWMTPSRLQERAGFRDGFEQAVLAALPGCQILAESGERLWNTSTLLMPDIDCRMRWVVKLDRKVLAVLPVRPVQGSGESFHVMSHGTHPRRVQSGGAFSAWLAGKPRLQTGFWLRHRCEGSLSSRTDPPALKPCAELPGQNAA